MHKDIIEDKPEISTACKLLIYLTSFSYFAFYVYSKVRISWKIIYRRIIIDVVIIFICLESLWVKHPSDFLNQLKFILIMEAWLFSYLDFKKYVIS